MFNGWWFGKDKDYGDFRSLEDNESIKIIIKGNGFVWKKTFTIDEVKKVITTQSSGC